MSITISCPSCGKVGYAPESAAGKLAKCRGCGGAVTIPAVGLTAARVTAPPVPVGAKICTGCGIDVSGQKRTKDTAGRYYCQPCWDAKVAAGAATDLSAGAPAPALTASVGATRPTTTTTKAPPPLPALPPRVEVDADGFAQLPTALDDVEDTTGYEECPQCGTHFPPGQFVLGEGDQMVCKACARREVDLAPPPLPARVLPAAAVPAAPARVVPQYQAPRKYQAQSNPNSPHGRRMLIGGVICAIGIVVTVGSYMSATAGGGGGRYVVAWGAILFGGIRFVVGLVGKISEG